MFFITSYIILVSSDDETNIGTTCIEVVPEKYRCEYLNCIAEKRIFDSMQYCLQLTSGQYYKLLKDGRINFETHIFVNAKYDLKLGLLISEEEFNQNII